MFSNRTVQEIIKTINFRTHNDFDNFLIYFELPEELSVDSISKKETTLVNFLIKNRNLKGPNNSLLSLEIIEYILEKESITYSRHSNIKNLNNALKRDGYEIIEKTVRKVLPEEVPVIEYENRLIEILKRYDFKTAVGHYSQAIASHGRGDWAAANAQFRSFVEDFFEQVHSLIQAGEGVSTNQKRG